MSKQPEIDELTLRRAQCGDRDACRSLVQFYQGQVFGLCLRVVGHQDRCLAEDAAQETFVDVFDRLSAFSWLGPARLSSWILTIASRRSIDMVRSRSSQTRLRDLLLNEKRIDELKSTVTPIVDLECALHSLSAEHRAVFILCDGYGFSYDEVAKGLKLPLGTVKSRLARARLSVREALQSQAANEKGAQQA